MAKSALAAISLFWGGYHLSAAEPSVGDPGTLLNPQLATRAIHFSRPDQASIELSEIEGNFVIGGSNGSLLTANNDENKMSLSGHAKVDYDLLLSEGLTSNNHKHWSLVSLNTFDKEGDGHWSPAALSTCSTSTDVFLGGHCKLGASNVEGYYNDLPQHTKAKITARIHFLDKWNGQSVYLRAGDNVVWTKSWNWCPQRSGEDCAKHGIDSCGHTFPDRMSVPLEIEIPHTSSALSLTFASTMDASHDPCEASWGVDDVAIYVQ